MWTAKTPETTQDLDWLQKMKDKKAAKEKVLTLNKEGSRK
jgi:hypothetical protein